MNKDIRTKDKHWLMNGDCLEELKKIKDCSVDMILCDPPYGTTACKWDTIIPFEPMWKELNRVIKPNGCIALFGSEPFSSHLRMSNIKNFKYDWIWEKSRPSGISQSGYMPMKSHEIISIFYNKLCNFYPIKEDRQYDGDKSTRKPWKTQNTGNNHGLLETDKKLFQEKANPKSVQFFKSLSPFPKGSIVHPTQKPVPLLEYLIKTYTNEGEIVLDFTMGSGSAGVAARNLNRKFIGIEKDEKYFEIAVNRINEVENANS